MNTNACRFAWIVLGGACVAGPAPQSQAAERGAYAYGDAGAVFTDDIQVREFPGAASGGKLKLDAGGRFSVGGGYRFSDWLLLGGETGVFANEVQGADASVAQLPFLANLELHLPNKSPLVPFIGGVPACRSA